MNIKKSNGLAVAALVAMALSGCGTSPVTGQRMVRVVETGAAASGDTLTAGAEGGAHGCRVETTEKPIEGELTMTYSGGEGGKCSVMYVR